MAMMQFSFGTKASGFLRGVINYLHLRCLTQAMLDPALWTASHVAVPIFKCLDQTPGGPGSGGACVNTVWIILSRGNKKTLLLLSRMHALASKSLSRDRDLTPRYYYKLSEKVSCLERIKNLIRLFFTFLFTQVR